MSDQIENPVKKMLNGDLILKGIGSEDNAKRLVYRFHYVEEKLESLQKKLSNGNISKLEPIMIELAGLTRDLLDITRESITLAHSTAFQQEQGLITPPNDSAESAETPGS